MKYTTRYLYVLALCVALIFLAACDQLEDFQPSILSFSANPSSIEAGESSTLSWSILGGPEDLAVILTPGDVELSKNRQLHRYTNSKQPNTP